MAIPEREKLPGCETNGRGSGGAFEVIVEYMSWVGAACAQYGPPWGELRLSTNFMGLGGGDEVDATLEELVLSEDTSVPCSSRTGKDSSLRKLLPLLVW